MSARRTPKPWPAISASEPIRWQRLGLESKAAATEKSLRASLGDAFGGAWFDEAGATVGLTQATACATFGHSGGPFLAGTQAQGVLSGIAGVCTSFFQPVQRHARLELY